MFGQIYQRWGIFWRPLVFPLRRVPIVIGAIFQLHNFLKDINDTNLPPIGTGLGAKRAYELRRAVNVTEGYDEEHHFSDECFTEVVVHPRVRRGQCPIREAITEALEADMILRPATHGSTLVEGVHL